MRPYGFRASGVMHDQSYKQRLDDLIETCRKIAIVCPGEAKGGYDELNNYLGKFATVTMLASPLDIQTNATLGYDGVIWQYGPEWWPKVEAAALIANLKRTIRVGVIETFNGSGGDVEYASVRHAHASSWWSNDFTALGLDWRYYWFARGATNYLIGYWDK